MLVRLYRTVKSCERAGHPHRKKTELARELLDVLAGWIGARRVEVAADSAYCNDTMTRGLPDNFVLFGAMRPDAVLTALPAARPRVREVRNRDSATGELHLRDEAVRTREEVGAERRPPEAREGVARQREDGGDEPRGRPWGRNEHWPGTLDHICSLPSPTPERAAPPEGPDAW